MFAEVYFRRMFVTLISACGIQKDCLIHERHRNGIERAACMPVEFNMASVDRVDCFYWTLEQPQYRLMRKVVIAKSFLLSERQIVGVRLTMDRTQ